MPELMRELGTRTLIELGAGNAEKSRIILDAMRATGLGELYVPIDVSATFLSQTAARLRREIPRARRRAGDRGHRGGAQPASPHAAAGLVRLPRQHHRQLLSAGSHPAAARVRAAMEAGDRFLMGVDLRKDIPGSRRRTTTARASRRSSTGTCCWC